MNAFEKKKKNLIGTWFSTLNSWWQKSHYSLCHSVKNYYYHQQSRSAVPDSQWVAGEFNKDIYSLCYTEANC